jgi:hypothetical protein
MQTQTRRKKGKASSANGGGEMTATKAKALLEAEEKRKLQACQAEINAVLEKYNCVLGAVPTVVHAGPGGGFVLGANVLIQPRQPEQG